MTGWVLETTAHGLYRTQGYVPPSSTRAIIVPEEFE